MNIDFKKLANKELSENNDSIKQNTTSGQESAKIDEITIVIRGGKIVKFEQRFV